MTMAIIATSASTGLSPKACGRRIKARDAEGVGIINEIGVIWARHIGVPCPFKQPVKVFIEKGQIKKFEGGAEAETLTRFYQFIAKYLGDAAYEVRGFHGGVHHRRSWSRTNAPTHPIAISSSTTTGAASTFTWATAGVARRFPI
jgi:hypothetical protein